MSCKVNVYKENKDKFEFLSAKFGQVAALQALLEADPNVEIDGFLSDVEIGNRVNAVTFSILTHLAKNTNGKSILDLAERDIKDVEFGKAIIKAKTDLETILGDNLAKGTEEANQIALRVFVALQNFDELVPKIKQRIESFSLKVSEKINDVEELVKEENSEEVKDRIYSQSTLETNRLDSVSPQIKLYISTLPMEKFSADGDVQLVLDDIGMPIPVDFHSVYSLLNKNLADLSSMEEMMEVMQDLAETNPTIKTIVEDLENGLMESDTAIMLKGKRIKNFENSFFSSFNNTYTDSITITTETKTDREGNKGLISSVIKTNKRELHRTLRNKWAQENRRIVQLSPKTKENLWNSKLQTVFNPLESVVRAKYETEKKKLFAKVNDFKNTAVLYKIQESLELLGIQMSQEGLQLMRKEMNKYNKEAFSEFVYGSSNSIYNLAVKAWKEGKDIFAEETSTINKLAKAESKVTTDLAANSFMNGEGNQVYPINLPTAASELFRDLVKGTKRLTQFLEHPMMGYFRALKQFQSKTKLLEFVSFDTLYNNDLGEGIPFDKLDPASSIIARFKAFMNYNVKGVASSKEGWFLVPTPADRSGSNAIKLQKLSNTNFTFEGLLSFGEYREWVDNMVKGEFARIQLVRQEFNSQPDKSKLVKDYHYNSKTGELGNGGYFNYYPTLNKYLEIDSDGQLKPFDIKNPEVIKAINEAIVSQIKADIDYMETIGVISPLQVNLNGDKIYEKLTLSEHSAKMINSTTVNDKNIMSFIVNSIVANHEMSIIFNGDLAFFKPIDVETGDQTSQLADANKRAGLAYTPGRKLRVGANGANATFRVAFANDITGESSLYSLYESILGPKQAKKYLSMDVTDGQGLVSLGRYADILSGLGELTPSIAVTIAELQKPNPDWSKVTVPLQPIKGFLQTNRFDPVFGRVMFQNLKYSLLPVIPSAIANNPTMQYIHNKMVEAKVDEFVFVSGAKGGAYNINTIGQQEPLNTVEMSNLDWRMPQVVPYKTKTMENFGTQIRKLIMGNIRKYGNYNGISGEQLQATYQTAISKKLENSFKELLSDISENGKVDIGLVARKVLTDLSKNTFKSTSDFITKALEVVTLADGTKDTRIPMSFPAIKHRVESSLNSLVRKAVTKQTIPGFSAVQYTGLGYGQESAIIGELQKELKFVRLAKNGVELTEEETKEYLKNPTNDVTVLPAEVIISPQYFIQSLLKKRDKLIKESKKSNNAEVSTTKIDPSVKQVFENYSVLSSIGTLTQYSEYLKTVFPNSKVKKITYHWARTPFDVYDKSKREAASSDLGEYLNVSVDKEIWKDYAKRTSGGDPILQSYVINLQNPYYTVDYYADKLRHNSRKNEEDPWFEDIIENTYDGIVENDGNQIAIFNEESALKLGSARDIEGFKNFVNNNNGKSSIKDIDLIISELKKGNFDVELIPKELREFVLYRIPTQGKNSMLPAVIKGFTPESMGSTIVIPAEITTQSGADYDIDKVYMEFKHFNFGTVSGFSSIPASLNTSEGLDNTIVNTHFSVLTSPIHFEELITPNNTDTLSELVKEISTIYSTENRGRLWSSLATQDDFREKNQAGGIFIGIASIANTAHALFQELGVTLSSRHSTETGVVINGNEVNSLSKTYTTNKKGEDTSRLISDDHMEVQNAAVDNAKSPILGNLNINTITGSTYLFLVEAGVGLKYATKLINTPIIRELTSLTRRNEATMGVDGAFQSALDEIAKSKDINISEVSLQDFDVTENILDEVLSKAKNGQFSTIYDGDILKAFLTFRMYGQDLHAVQAALKTDNDGAHQTLAANIIHWDKLAKVQGTYANETYHKDYPSEELNPIKTIKLDREKYKNHSIQAYEVYGLKKAIDLTSVFISDSTPAFKKVLKSFQNSIGGNMIESDLRLLMNDFYTYLFANSKANYTGKKSALSAYTSEDIAKLLVGNDSVGNRVMKAQKLEIQKAKDDVSYIPNQFIMSLTVELKDKKSGYDVVSFNNTISKTLSGDQKTMLSSEMMKLFLDNSEFMNDLGQDLFLYNFFTEGFGRGINSFSDYIPVELYELIENPETNETLVDYFRNSRADFNDYTNFSIDDFLPRFLLNRSRELKGVKNTGNRNPKQVREFLEGNPKISYFFTKKGSSIVLAKRRPGSSYYDVIGEPVGVSGVHVEYQNGEFISQGKDVTNVYKMASISGDVVDNNQCAV